MFGTQLPQKAPGKHCGECTMCCKALEIEHFDKPMGVVCQHRCKQGCAIYPERPKICREFLCEWLMDRNLGAPLRPDKISTIFMEDPDTEDYQAVCDPDKPNAWRNPMVMRHLLRLAREGRVVVAKSGMRAWRIYPDGHCVEWA